ncbi:MAG: nucleotidyltransferase family protein [Pseudomonadota bacterium]|nr:nucleotidyltransferase family protein [Pseudomonadota bacterium]
MKAMILAAGRGERMRPLTDHTPKPLLSVRGQPLIEWHAQALARGGFTELVINTAWLGEQIAGHFERQPRQSEQAPQSITYSHEGADFGGALETAGGIARALPLLGEVFWVLAGDVFVPGFEFSATAVCRFMQSDKLAHLWLVPNPAHNPRGDFGLGEGGLALNLPPDNDTPRYTYSTIGLYRRALFDALPFGNPQGLAAPLAPLLRAAMDRGQVSAELYEGDWTDVGTPARLAELNQNA